MRFSKRWLQKLLEWKSRDEALIQEHEKRLNAQAESISSNAAVAHFTKHRLQSKWSSFRVQKCSKKLIKDARFRCAGHGKKKGSFCFNLSKDKRSWEAAEQRCNRQGGSLAVIKDEDTMLFISNLMRGSSYVSLARSLTVKNAVSELSFQDTSYWVGLSLDKESDRLSWVDNTTVTDSSFQNWYGEIRPTVSSTTHPLFSTILALGAMHSVCGSTVRLQMVPLKMRPRVPLHLPSLTLFL